MAYSKGNPVRHVTGPLVFIGQSGMTQRNSNCHVTEPLVFIGQSSLTQSEVTFGLIAGYPFCRFTTYARNPVSSIVYFRPSQRGSDENRCLIADFVGMQGNI